MSKEADQQQIPFVLPPLGLEASTVVATNWFAKLGGRVLEGDRLLEIMAGDIIVDLPAPATGVLRAKQVAEDDELTTGQLLGYVATEAS